VRILLDESLPRGLKGLKNGELLRLASGAFDVFVTADQNLEHQQNIASLPLAVVVLVARTNRWKRTYRSPRSSAKQSRLRVLEPSQEWPPNHLIIAGDEAGAARWSLTAELSVGRTGIEHAYQDW